jgi:hypothetical protein
MRTVQSGHGISTTRASLSGPHGLIDRRWLPRRLASSIVLLSLLLALSVGHLPGTGSFAVQSASAESVDESTCVSGYGLFCEAMGGDGGDACFDAVGRAAWDCTVAVVFGGEDPTGELIAGCINDLGQVGEDCRAGSLPDCGKYPNSLACGRNTFP